MASSSNTPSANTRKPPAATPTAPTWTNQQIHANAANWSLQGDAQLLEIMQNLSHHLDHRCTSTKANIDRMQHDLVGANLRLENTVNKMLSLKNLQFIEARVRDDVDVGSQNTVKTSPAAVKPALTAELAIRTAVDNGLSMLNRCYEKVTLHLDDDSEAEDEVDETMRQASIVFRARNPHQARLLPHLIGSREWTDKWHVGLVESDDDDDEGEKEADDEDANRRQRSQVSRQATVAEEYSSSEDDTISMSVSLPSNAHTGTCTGSENSDSQPSTARPSLIVNPGLDRMFDMLRPGADLIQPTQPVESHRVNPSNLFDESDSGEEGTVQQALPVHVSVKSAVEAQRVRVLPALPTTQNVLAAAGQVESRRVENVGASAPMFRQPIQQSQPAQSPGTTLGLFDDEPPELDAPVVATRKPVNLFLDDSDDADDDSDFIASIKQSTSHLPVHQPPVAQPTATARTINVPAKTGNLFDSTGSDPEEYVPKPKPAKTASTVEKPLAKSNIHNLFDDSPPDDLFDELMSTNKSTTMKTHILADDDELFGDKTSSVLPQTSRANDPVSNDPRNVPETKKPSGFDGSEKLFAENEATNSTKPNQSEKPLEVSTTSKKNIFDEDYDELFYEKEVSTAPTIKQDITIFDDENNDLFSNVQKKASNDKPAVFSAIQQPAAKTNNIFDDIFGDEPAEDDFASIFAKPKPTLTVPLNKTSLFESDSNESRDEWKPQTTNKTEPSSIPSSSGTIINTPVTDVSSSFTDARTENVASNPNTPERYANFYATNNSTENGSKRVEDRRPFVSYLDNDSPPDFDEWGSANNGDLFGSSNKEFPESENSIVGQIITSEHIAVNKEVIVNSDTTVHIAETVYTSAVLVEGDNDEFLDKDEPPKFENGKPYDEAVSYVIDKQMHSGSEDDIVSEGLYDAPTSIMPVEPDHKTILSKKTSSSVFLFDDEPPEDDFQDIFSTPAAEKSKVMPTFFDEMPPDDDPFEHKQQSAVRASPLSHTKSVALFDDEPPEDETFEKRKEPATPTVTKSQFSSGLFDDMPPDDDMYSPLKSSVPKSNSSDRQIESQPSKPNAVYAAPNTIQNKKMYYEDFDDTIVVPTPQATTVIKSSNAVIINQTSELLKSKINKFTQPAAIDVGPVAVADKPKPKKLNTNLQINVAALLPGAKRATVSKLASPEELVYSEDETDKQLDADALKSSSVLSNTSVPEVSTGLLVGLNKGRAKITVKRRPSTRTGRQNEYRKSLLANGVLHIDGVDKMPHEENRSDLQSEQPTEKSFAEMLQSDNEDDEWLAARITAPKKTEIGSTSTLKQSAFADRESDKDSKAIIPKSVSAAPQSFPAKVNLFDADDDNNDDDLFGAAARKQPSIKKTPETIQPKVPSVNNSTMNVSKDIKLPTALAGSSLFDSADDDDDLFAPKPILKTAISNIKQNRSLFGDSDEDDDDDYLFGSSKKTTSSKGSSKAPSRINESATSSSPHDPLADLWKDV